MVLALLIVAAVADLALAGLLIAVSGFIIGAGPESMHSGSAVMAAWIAMVIFCIAAPVGGFMWRTHRRPATGLAPCMAAAVRRARRRIASAALLSP
jgi:hypothetical protein